MPRESLKILSSPESRQYYWKFVHSPKGTARMWTTIAGMCPLSRGRECGGVLQRTGIDGWDVCWLESVDRKRQNLSTLRRVLLECGQEMWEYVHSPGKAEGLAYRIIHIYRAMLWNRSSDRAMTGYWRADGKTPTLCNRLS